MNKPKTFIPFFSSRPTLWGVHSESLHGRGVHSLFANALRAAIRRLQSMSLTCFGGSALCCVCTGTLLRWRASNRPTRQAQRYMLAPDEEDEEDELLQSDMVVEPRFTASSEGGSDVESEARAHRHRPLYFAVGYAAPARSPCGSPSRLTLVDVLGWRPAKRRLCPRPRGVAVRLREQRGG